MVLNKHYYYDEIFRDIRELLRHTRNLLPAVSWGQVMTSGIFP